jgi:hypothetical protein
LSQSPIPVFIRYLWECQKRKKIGLKRREAKMGHYKAVGEVLRYMGAVSREKAEDKEVVEGLIIAAGAAETLRDPIGKASNVNFMAYFIDKGKIELLPTPPALNPCFVRRIRTQGYDSVIEQLEKISVETGTE